MLPGDERMWLPPTTMINREYYARRDEREREDKARRAATRAAKRKKAAEKAEEEIAIKRMRKRFGMDNRVYVNFDGTEFRWNESRQSCQPTHSQTAQQFTQSVQREVAQTQSHQQTTDQPGHGTNAMVQCRTIQHIVPTDKNSAKTVQLVTKAIASRREFSIARNHVQREAYQVEDLIGSLDNVVGQVRRGVVQARVQMDDMDARFVDFVGAHHDMMEHLQANGIVQDAGSDYYDLTRERWGAGKQRPQRNDDVN